MNLLMYLKLTNSLFFKSYSIVVGIWIAVAILAFPYIRGDSFREGITLMAPSVHEKMHAVDARRGRSKDHIITL